MKQLSPTDAVPVLRGDVVFSDRPSGTGAEVIDIRPIGFGHGARLHGFELSLARMLDGRRSAQDVVSHAARLGMPLSLHGLESFIRHLEQHRLLARTVGEAASPVSPWAERNEWEPTTRLQYQIALKAVRAGRPEEARGELDNLLAQSPSLDEARALRDWLDAHPDAVSNGESFRETFERAERSWLTRGASTSRQVLQVPLRDAPLGDDELHAVRPSLTPALLLIALVMIGALTLLVPTPTVVSVPAQLVPVMVTPIDAPFGGTIGAVSVNEGDWVWAGQAVISYSQPRGKIISAAGEGAARELVASPGRTVVQGQRLMQLEDTRQLKLTARLDPTQARDVREGQTATIALGNRRAKTVVNELNGRTLLTTVDNTNQVMEPGRAVIDVDIGWRSLLQRMMH